MNSLEFLRPRVLRFPVAELRRWFLPLLLTVVVYGFQSNPVNAGAVHVTQDDLHLPSHISVASDKIQSSINNWQQFIRRSSGLSISQKLEAVNSYFNRLRFMEDTRMWSEADYWATPLQLLTVGAGDCEDFAIAKFFALKALGVPVDRLRVMYVRYYKHGQGEPRAHMVLTYTPEPQAEPLVLDNLTSKIDTISQRKELQVVYAFNTEKFWLPGEIHVDVEAGGPGQLPQWRNLDKRLQHDLALLGL